MRPYQLRTSGRKTKAPSPVSSQAQPRCSSGLRVVAATDSGRTKVCSRSTSAHRSSRFPSWSETASARCSSSPRRVASAGSAASFFRDLPSRRLSVSSPVIVCNPRQPRRGAPPCCAVRVRAPLPARRHIPLCHRDGTA
ncbi:hypothetical protein ACFQVA_26730 [Actinomadura keratinilytica]